MVMSGGGDGASGSAEGGSLSERNSPEAHNLCVTVVGHSPYDAVVHTKQHGKRPASTRTVRKQRVSVFFGFHPASFKPSARTFNVLREDVSLLLKTGKAKHGEWFHKGERLPGRDGQPELSSNLIEAAVATPIFPDVERELDLTDGCAAQFDGKVNYHQVAVWPTKVTAPARAHAIGRQRTVTRPGEIWP